MDAAAQRKAKLAALRKEFGNGTQSSEPQPPPVEPRAIIKEAEAEVEKFVSEAVNAELAREDVEVDVTNLAPQKPNADLKRGIESKLNKLDRMTQRAIVDLIRKRIRSSGELDTMPANMSGPADDEDD
ncbi:cwf18 pre-mRNA splicing factor-domain-containing protein [Cladochytrium replicatum]|nr:cwf18 pre-mRNA splicing factor-domain-containing protein [Cladochytrium replicatum]